MEIILSTNKQLLYEKIRTTKVFRSIKFLINKRDKINTISDIYDFVDNIINHPTQDLKAFEVNLNRVSLKIAEVLWIKEIFIGRSVIESLLFSLIKDSHVNDLYISRSEIVHQGRTVMNPDLMNCRKAFVHTFLFVVNRLENLPVKSETPIAHLFNDYETDD